MKVVHTGLWMQAGDTWRFTAAGAWGGPFGACGPEGRPSGLGDLLRFNPCAADAPRYCLMGMLDHDYATTFRIGAGADHDFARSGRLVVFANAALPFYWNDAGRVLLVADRLSPAREADQPPNISNEDRTMMVGAVGFEPTTR